MPRKPTDYKKLYQESNELFKEQQLNVEFAIQKLDELENKYKNLSKEFDVAVETNTKFHQTIIEQRGIIHYLEAQVSKMDKIISELEKNERT
jgi:small-conductance mechanosensitive channel